MRSIETSLMIFAFYIASMNAQKIQGRTVTAWLSCSVSEHCGWNSQCRNGVCECTEGFVSSENEHDCVNPLCTDRRCISCNNRDSCKRCVDFIEEATGKCLSKCETEYSLVIEGFLLGKVCKVPTKSSKVGPLAISIMIGVSCGVVFMGTTLLFYCWKNRNKKINRTRGMPQELKEKTDDKRMDKQFVHEYHVNNYGNAHSDVDGESEDLTQQQQRHVRFHRQVAYLQPHIGTFCDMLKEVKWQLRSAVAGTSKHKIYSNTASHLLRTLSLLNDPATDIPEDSDSLMTWAARVLQQYIDIQTDRDNRDCRLSSHQIVVEVVQHNDTASISADSGHQTDSAPELTSTFKPELLLVPTDESVANRISGSTSFHYERREKIDEPNSHNVFVLDPTHTEDESSAIEV